MFNKSVAGTFIRRRKGRKNVQAIKLGEKSEEQKQIDSRGDTDLCHVKRIKTGKIKMIESAKGLEEVRRPAELHPL